MEKLSDSQYADFFEYFLIRKVASSESFLKASVRVLKKFSTWLYEEQYIDEVAYQELSGYFSDGKSKAIPNAEKAAKLLYQRSANSPDRNYEKVYEGYFKIIDKQATQLFLEVMFEAEEIGPINVTKQIADLCQEGWDISGVTGMYKGKWYFVEVWNVYPTS